MFLRDKVQYLILTLDPGVPKTEKLPWLAFFNGGLRAVVVAFALGALATAVVGVPVVSVGNALLAAFETKNELIDGRTPASGIMIFDNN